MAESVKIVRVEHEVTKNGLTLTSVAHLQDGRSIASSVGWADLETARAHYAQAKAYFEANASNLVCARHTGDRRRLRVFRTRFGDLHLGINTGPPTWWRPRFSVRRWSVRGGWLRLAIQLGWSRR